MSEDAWPSNEVEGGQLPRVEDLPVAAQGYDQEAVRLAFEAFYRHAARLDVSLRALDAVEAFRRDADAVRNDLRALRALGAGSAFEQSWTPRSHEHVRPGGIDVALRLIAESALIVAVAVLAGVGHLRTATIVALMAGAFVVVAFSEWLASRSRFVPPVAVYPAPELPLTAPSPAPSVAASPVREWGPPAEVSEDTEPEALTVVEAPAANGDGLAAAAADPWEQGPEVDDDAEHESVPVVETPV